MARKYSSRQFFRSFLSKGIDAYVDKEDDEKVADLSRRERRQYYLQEYRKWLYPYRLGLSGIFALATFAMLLEMVLPAATGRIIDSVLGSKTLDQDERFSTERRDCRLQQ